LRNHIIYLIRSIYINLYEFMCSYEAKNDEKSK
jgi:hypothetical protein